MSIFTGAGVALITPMNPDGSINYPEMEHIINDQIAGGTDAVIVCGTTGETATMTYDEHIETIRACVQMTAGRIPVIAGTGSNCTKSAVKLSVAAERAGADGLLVVSPYYNKATQNGIKAHYKQIAAAVDLPILMYNIKGRPVLILLHRQSLIWCRRFLILWVSKKHPEICHRLPTLWRVVTERSICIPEMMIR